MKELILWLKDNPPVDWETCDWTGSKFFLIYEPMIGEWVVGYEGRGGFTTIACNEDLEIALKMAKEEISKINEKGEIKE